ncbi:3-hydroxybutyrate dehydrogenase [Asticcacaulis sp. DW145]|jgi:3-hydroxybutyrate dehydrogenase|uniref:3-hydroxybutyrate dehydrogenase n=1 Tax=Asticcacaulis currens TaxID=2984210 RepID=A0ABT5II21_9CAUL|nr:3-hydroxybutyrate dehydrogenase [Asticcacaulis currens]MDC7695858.1 3-hydroxybutyrate dehydrogenase [Asticcacaulis currens]BEV11303.1 3-hydroxybutyrate dehydrogenase [Asticcacaulis sp. DW145]
MLTGKTALVTGSTSGIGLAIARKLASKGAKVMLNGMGDPTEIENLRAGMASEFGVEVAFNGADLTKVEAIEALIADTTQKLGALDILVNNAGIQHVSPIEDFPVDKWNMIIALNLSAAFHTTRLSFKGMKDRGWGRIINIASAHALVASPFKAAYVAAKHGIAGLTKTIALEGAEHGITCNAICPGYVLTPLVEKQIPDTAKARGLTEEQVIKDVLLAAQPTKKFVETDDIAELVLFLSSDAARSITGALQSIDGGWTAA